MVIYYIIIVIGIECSYLWMKSLCLTLRLCYLLHGYSLYSLQNSQYLKHNEWETWYKNRFVATRHQKFYQANIICTSIRTLFLKWKRGILFYSQSRLNLLAWQPKHLLWNVIEGMLALNRMWIYKGTISLYCGFLLYFSNVRWLLWLTEFRLRQKAKNIL